LHIEGGIFQPSDFLSAEECKFRTDSLTFKENQEYQVILDGFKFNGAREKRTATYPFRIPLSTLQDNYEQVYRYTLAQERRLAKQEQTQEFNAEFYKTVEHGMFKEIRPEEMAAWDGLVNYISI
jgi:hypothetical protein